jgi:glycosyltransferase involved in cell wall biosynthesis
VFFQNADDRRDFEAWRLLARTTRVEMVRGSGVDPALFAIAALPPPPVRFVFLGRLLADKGFRDYVAMARAIRARHPDVRFRVAGWIDPNPNSVTQLELDGWVREGIVEYAGPLDDVRPLLEDSHVLVLPSRREGTPRTVLEAMAMGRGVITTDAPGCRDTVEHGTSGLLVTVGDLDQLVSAGLRFVAEPDLARRMGAAAAERARQLFDARGIASQMVSALAL